jgi:hypothetical protein
LVSSTTNAGYVNHDLIMALPGTDPDGSPFSFRVLSLPINGALFQYTNGSRGAAINTPNSLISDSLGRLIFAPNTGETGNPYATFSFRAENTFYGSAPAQATVSIGLPAEPQITSALWNQTNPGAPVFDVSFAGSPNATYSVQASTNLTDWANIGAALETSLAQYKFADVTATNWMQRFYRVTAP